MISLTPAGFSSVLDETRHCSHSVSCLDSHFSRPRSKKQQIVAISTAQLPQFDFFYLNYSYKRCLCKMSHNSYWSLNWCIIKLLASALISNSPEFSLYWEKPEYSEQCSNVLSLVRYVKIVLTWQKVLNLVNSFCMMWNLGHYQLSWGTLIE